MVYDVILQSILGKFQAGIYSKGVAEGYTGCCRLPEEEKFWEQTFAFKHTTLSSQINDKLRQARDKISTGEVTVPSGFT